MPSRGWYTAAREVASCPLAREAAWWNGTSAPVPERDRQGSDGGMGLLSGLRVVEGSAFVDYSVGVTAARDGRANAMSPSAPRARTPTAAATTQTSSTVLGSGAVAFVT